MWCRQLHNVLFFFFFKFFILFSVTFTRRPNLFRFGVVNKSETKWREVNFELHERRPFVCLVYENSSFFIPLEYRNTVSLPLKTSLKFSFLLFFSSSSSSFVSHDYIFIFNLLIWLVVVNVCLFVCGWFLFWFPVIVDSDDLPSSCLHPFVSAASFLPPPPNLMLFLLIFAPSFPPPPVCPPGVSAASGRGKGWSRRTWAGCCRCGTCTWNPASCTRCLCWRSAPTCWWCGSSSAWRTSWPKFAAAERLRGHEDAF